MAEVVQTGEFLSEEMVLLEWEVDLEDGEELVLPLRSYLPDGQAILLIQAIGEVDSLDGLEVTPPPMLDELIPDVERQPPVRGRIFETQGGIENEDISARFKSGIKRRFRAIWGQIRGGFSRLARNACGLCKAAAKLLINIVLTAHNCPTLPDGTFDASRLQGVLQAIGQDIRAGRYGRTAQQISAALGQQCWAAILNVLRATGWLFKLTDHVLQGICWALGFCPRPNFRGPAAP